MRTRKSSTPKKPVAVEERHGDNHAEKLSVPAGREGAGFVCSLVPMVFLPVFRLVARVRHDAAIIQLQDAGFVSSGLDGGRLFEIQGGMDYPVKR